MVKGFKAILAATSAKKTVVDRGDKAAEGARPSRQAKTNASTAWAPLVPQSATSVSASDLKRKASRSSTKSQSISANEVPAKGPKSSTILERLSFGRKKAKTVQEVAKKNDGYKAPSMDGPEEADPKPTQVEEESALVKELKAKVAAMKTAARQAAKDQDSGGSEEEPTTMPVIDDSDDDDLPEAHTLGQKERAAAVEAQDLFNEGAVVVEKAVSRKSSRMSIVYSDDEEELNRNVGTFRDWRSKASSMSSVNLTGAANIEDDDDDDYDNGQHASQSDNDLEAAQLLQIFVDHGVEHGFDLDGDDLTPEMVAAIQAAQRRKEIATADDLVETEWDDKQAAVPRPRRKVPKLGNSKILQREYAEFPANDPPGKVYRKESSRAKQVVAEDGPTKDNTVTRMTRVEAEPQTVNNQDALVTWMAADEDPVASRSSSDTVWMPRTHIVVNKVGGRLVMGKKNQSKHIGRWMGGSIEYSLLLFLGRVVGFVPQPFSAGGLEIMAMEALIVTATEHNLNTRSTDVLARVQDDEEYTTPLINYIVQRLITYRTTFKLAGDTIVPSVLNLEKTDAGRARARAMLDDLSYHCGANSTTGAPDLGKPYQHEVVQRMVNATLAKMPALMLGLVVTAIHAVLMEWSRNSKDQFSGNNVEGAFKSHMAMLDALKERKPAATGLNLSQLMGCPMLRSSPLHSWDAIGDE
ncbi:hypothetical protein BDZ89DRAFT_1138024 [Hymenopellis radicata]|nr:hypothetical protein BDZ89DRAFT_1138024 [Hymenopellis radicata]